MSQTRDLVIRQLNDFAGDEHHLKWRRKRVPMLVGGGCTLGMGLIDIAEEEHCGET